MTHAIACLLHHVAASCVGDGYTYVRAGADKLATMADARRLGLVESPERGRGELDLYWLRLTPDGRRVADESLLAARVLIGGAP